MLKTMTDNVGSWVIRPDDICSIKYEYRGGENQFKILRDAFNSHNDAKLIDRVMQSPLSNVYKAMENFHYSSTVLHELLVRSVYSERPEELMFRFKNRICRFGRREFAMITGLSFGPIEPDVRPDEDKQRSTLTSYVDDDNVVVDTTDRACPFSIKTRNITIALLEQALKDSTDAEVAYKIGLVYLIEAVLNGKSSAAHVSPFLFHLVDDTSRFVNYSWGSYFWDITLTDLKEKRDGLRSHIGRSSKVTKDVACLVYALFVWAYETVPYVGKVLASHVSNEVPRMLRWHPNSGRVVNEWLKKQLDFHGLGVVSFMKPSDEERLMLRGNGLTYEEIDTSPPMYTIHVDDAHVDRAIDPQITDLKDENTFGGNFVSTHVDIPSRMREELSVIDEKLNESVNKLEKHVNERIEDSTNTVVYTRNVLLGDIQDTRIAIRKHLREMKSIVSKMVNSSKRHKGTTQPHTSSPLVMRQETQPQDDQHTVSESKIEKHAMETPTDKKGGNNLASSSKHTPKRYFPPRPLVRTYNFRQEEMLLTILKSVMKNEVSKTKKKAFQVDNPPPMTNLGTHLSHVSDTDTCIGNNSPIDALQINAPVEILNVSDSPSKPTPKRVIQEKLPEFPRSRRKTQRPDRLKDFVDNSMVERIRPKCYDPFRPIDIGKWREFRDWYNNPNAPKVTIDGVFLNCTSRLELVDAVWFEDIYRPQRWLGNTHVNAYLYLLHCRMKKHPTSFKKDAVIFSHELGYVVGLMQHNELRKTSKLDIVVHNGVNAFTKQNTVYTPWRFGNHWVALVISIASWDITVYDCMCGMGEEDAMDEELRGWANFFPMLLRLNPVFKDDARLSKAFEVKRLNSNACPQMSKIGDCGVFTVKHIEHLILLNASLGDVTQDNMELFRNKMCVDIFHRTVDL